MSEDSLPKTTIIFSEADVKENSFVAAIGYISILFLIPLLLKKDSPFAQFHAKQGLYLFVIFFVGQVVFWFPIFGWGLALFVFLVNVYAFFQALSGNAWEVPGAKWFLKKLNL
jgi:uncharacterized membrane protein